MGKTVRKLKPYCLLCYTTLEKDEPFCPRCGFNNRKDLRRRYWTREPNLVETEFVVKVIAVLVSLIVAITAVLYIISESKLRGYYSGWAFALGPVALCYALWETASMITQRGRIFKPTLVWGVSSLLLALLFLAFDYMVSILFVLLALGIVLLGKGLRKWKYNKIGAENWYD